MATYRLTFNATTTTRLDFVDADVVSDNSVTYVYQNGKKAFAIPSANLVAVEAIPTPEPAKPDEPVA